MISTIILFISKIRNNFFQELLLLKEKHIIFLIYSSKIAINSLQFMQKIFTFEFIDSLCKVAFINTCIRKIIVENI